MTRYGKWFIYLGFIFGMMTVFSCSEKNKYGDLGSNELAKGIRYDSLIYGIHFGMTNEEFGNYCADMNRKKIFMPNLNGTAVSLELKNGFNSPVYIEFFPRFENGRNITKLEAILNYRDFSYYNKNYAIENLVKETKANFEKGYGGNAFLEVPYKNSLLKSQYIKIDGNRKIVLSPNFDGQKLNVEFEDLKPAN